MGRYLPSAVGPHQVVEDEGLGLDVSDTLCDVGPDAGARPARDAHHGHEAGQPVAVLRLLPQQLLHRVSVTRPVDTVPAEEGGRPCDTVLQLKSQQKNSGNV